MRRRARAGACTPLLLRLRSMAGTADDDLSVLEEDSEQLEREACGSTEASIKRPISVLLRINANSKKSLADRQLTKNDEIAGVKLLVMERAGRPRRRGTFREHELQLRVVPQVPLGAANALGDERWRGLVACAS